MNTAEEIIKEYTDSHSITTMLLESIREARKYGFRMYQYDGSFNEEQNLFWSAIFCLSLACKKSILDQNDIGSELFKSNIKELLKKKSILKKDAQFILDITPKTRRL